MSTNRHMGQESKYCGNERQLNVNGRHQNRFLLLTPVSIKILNCEEFSMTFSHLKTNYTKLSHYRPKIRKVIRLSFLDGTSPFVYL